MLIKKEVIDRIGGFDLRFGLGNFEDDDFCLRARIAGYKIWICNDVFIHHFGSKTYSGNRIDYTTLMRENWEKFKEKWHLPKDCLVENGYNSTTLIKQKFSYNLHYYPVEFSYKRQSNQLFIQGRRKICFLVIPNWQKQANGEWRQILKEFILTFGANGNATLALRVCSEVNMVEHAYLQACEVFTELNLNPDHYSNVVLLNDPLREDEEGRLFATADVFIKLSDSDSRYEELAKEFSCPVVSPKDKNISLESIYKKLIEFNHKFI